MIFEGLPTTPTAEELIDKAFSRASRAGRAKSGLEAQRSMLQTAANILSDNLGQVVESWPDFDAVDPFYRELAEAVIRSADPAGEDDRFGVDALRHSLSEVGWASRKTREIHQEYQGRLAGDVDTARKLRKQAFARLADVVEEVDSDLARIAAAREALRGLPDIRADEPAIVVAGYPNVGKSSFVNRVTNARNETAAYPFTTTEIRVGHYEADDRLRYQLIDTPGLLDRPADERNEIEAQAVSALAHLADAVVVLVDPSETCGYPLADQLELRDSVARQFGDVPVLTVANKADLEAVGPVPDCDAEMSATGGEGVEDALAMAVDAVEFEPELPFEG